jgi:hypothetical protein
MPAADPAYIFRAKTQDGYVFKVLIELLQQILITACFDIRADGIALRMQDSHHRVLVNIELDAAQFNVFEVRDPLVQIGINLTHFYKMLKSIKKKDALVLFIEAARPSVLQFHVLPPDNGRKAHSTIQIQNLPNIIIRDMPTDYPHPVLLSSSEYQSTLKDMNNISSTLQVELRRNAFSLSAYSENVLSRCVQFGELDDASPVTYSEQFEMEQFNRVLKIAGLGKTLAIFGTHTKPLQIRSSVGTLGNISVFMKSIRQSKTAP